MNLVDSLLNFLKKKGTPEELKAPEGVCPNCWGREEYGGHFYERVKQENLDVLSKESNVGWINAYANKHLAGIVLQRMGKGEELICAKCKVSYTHSDKHADS